MIEKYKNKKWLYNNYHNNKKTIKEIAIMCECGETTIGRWMKRFGINTRNNRDAQTIHKKVYMDKEWLYNQYHIEKKSQKQIAKECGCVEETINRWLKNLGIKIRSKSEYITLSHGTENAKYRDKDWLYNEYVVKGKSSVEIAKNLGCTRPTILKWLRKHNIKIKSLQESILQAKGSYNRKYANEEWLSDKYLNCWMSVQEIAEECNTDTDTIYRWLHKFNIPVRNKSTLPISLPPDFRYCSCCNTIKHETEFIPSSKHVCKVCRNMLENKRRRSLNNIPLNEWFDGSEGHHVTNDYVLYIPKEIHRKCNGRNTMLHRVLVFNELVRQRKLDDIDLILSIYGKKLSDL